MDGFDLGIGMLVALAAVSATTPFLAFDYYHRWLTMPSVALAAPVPILVGLGALVFFRALRSGRDRLPFVIALSWFLLGSPARAGPGKPRARCGNASAGWS